MTILLSGISNHLPTPTKFVDFQPKLETKTKVYKQEIESYEIPLEIEPNEILNVGP